LRQAGNEGSEHYPRLLVIVGENSHITIIDEYSGGPEDPDAEICYSNGAVEFFVGRESKCCYVMLQRQTHSVNSYLTYRAAVEQGAELLTVPLSFGAGQSKQNFGIRINGENSSSRIHGLLFGSERQRFDNHTLHHHAANRTESNIDFKVVLRDRANSAYTGLIRIDQTSRGCQAYQENRNLLLDDGTRAEAIPELEILNEDVQCSHGATAGPIDPETIFFLQARGIEAAEAVRIVVGGFVQSTLKQVPADIRDRISGFVSERLQEI